MIELIEDEILQILMGTDRPLRTGEIAERLGVSKPTVVSHLNKLKRQGKVKQVLYRNVSSWQCSREWGNVLQRAKRLEQRLEEMYGDKRFSPAEARERLKAEFRPEEFDFLLEMIQHIKPPVHELKVTRRLGCTPKQEAEAKRESNFSQLAAGAFTKVERVSRMLPRIAARARELQRIKETFNKRFWFLGDIPPPPQTDRKKIENEEGLNEMKRELNERYERLRREKYGSTDRPN